MRLTPRSAIFCEKSFSRLFAIGAAAALLVVGLAASAAQADEAAFPGQRSDEELASDGFKPLFDGKSMAAWDVKPWHEGHWSVHDGVINYDGKAERKRGQDASVWTKDSYGDFTLYAEWRLPSKPEMKPHPIVLYNGDFLMAEDNPRQRVTRPHLDAGDSGLYFRGNIKCQANIWSQVLGSGEINGYRTDKRVPAEVRRACIPIKNADRPLGEWNAFLITLKGNCMTVVLNGQTVIPAACLPDLAASGPIALQHHGDAVQFRRMWIKKLD